MRLKMLTKWEKLWLMLYNLIEIVMYSILYGRRFQNQKLVHLLICISIKQLKNTIELLLWMLNKGLFYVCLKFSDYLCSLDLCGEIGLSCMTIPHTQEQSPQLGTFKHVCHGHILFNTIRDRTVYFSLLFVFTWVISSLSRYLLLF